MSCWSCDIRDFMDAGLSGELDRDLLDFLDEVEDIGEPFSVSLCFSLSWRCFFCDKCAD